MRNPSRGLCFSLPSRAYVRNSLKQIHLDRYPLRCVSSRVSCLYRLTIFAYAQIKTAACLNSQSAGGYRIAAHTFYANIRNISSRQKPPFSVLAPSYGDVAVWLLFQDLRLVPSIPSAIYASVTWCWRVRILRDNPPANIMDA